MLPFGGNQIILHSEIQLMWVIHIAVIGGELADMSEQADEADLKSADDFIVWVQVPLSAWKAKAAG